VERALAWSHVFKRLRVRYGRRATIHHAPLGLACSVVCLHMLNNSK